MDWIKIKVNNNFKGCVCMLTVVAKSIVKKDKIEEFKKYADKIIEETRKEEGNISYNLYEDSKEPNIITFIEFWRSEEDLQKHFNSKHFTEIFPKMGELQESEGEVNIYNKIK